MLSTLKQLHTHHQPHLNECSGEETAVAAAATATAVTTAATAATAAAGSTRESILARSAPPLLT